MDFPFQLRSFQDEALQALNRVRHLILISSTGSGKSLVFQKYIHDRPNSKTVFISPLNALSRQMALRFEALGIPIFLERSPGSFETGVWMMSPEKWKNLNRDRLRQWMPEFLVVDEAHCVTEWGREFRPDYSSIFEIVSLPSITKTLWCSATLTLDDRYIIQKSLRDLAPGKTEILGHFKFPNLISLKKLELNPFQRLQWLQGWIHAKSAESGMIFCNTRASTQRIQKILEARAIRCVYYHAGLSLEEKKGIEKVLMEFRNRNDRVVIVATSAFGMGMDFDFFRFCILMEPPYSMLGMVQAVGRVGRARDLQGTADAFVLWSQEDFAGTRQGMERIAVRNWCESLENPVLSIENYFNQERLSGKMGMNVESGYSSH